ncbi:acylphosphatase [candidate division FCPU426 bacterium]|nr:acylphosphatase [candidate division FCPU426 bacterium]
MRRMRVTVTGRVQAVGYRYFSRAVAAPLQLSGYVKNQHDGSVLLEAQGPENQLRTFLQELQKGPRLAWVESLDVQWIEPIAGEEGFAIQH